jgi:L-asparaginase
MRRALEPLITMRPQKMWSYKFEKTSVGACAVVVVFATMDVASAQAVRPSTLPMVRVIATGGTIAGRGASSTSLSNYKSGALLGEELVKAVPEIKQYADVRVEQLFNVNSSDLTVANWVELANRINTIFADDPKLAGIVVTHGTNTLEETAYFLNLTVKHDRPVVVVGAQRPSTAISSDGPLNLLNAIRTASAPEARGKGVLVVMNDEINGARDVTKTSTYRVETFRSPDLGFLGYVDADKVSFYRASTKRHTAQSEFTVGAAIELPRVDIVYSYVETNVAILQALVMSGTKGIVFAGVGAGGLSRSDRAALKSLVSSQSGAGPVLVRSSRVGSGRVIADTANREEYDALGMVPADTLNPQKARVLLMLALAKTRDIGEIKRIFSEY